jgi:CRISPR-associated protein Cas2
MARRRVLVSYDIADEKRRTAVFKALRNFGDSVQFSVFLCELNEVERIRLVAILRERMHSREDRVLLVDLGKVDGGEEPAIEWLGRRPSPAPAVRVI